MKIRGVVANNRRKAFEVRTAKGVFYYPYSRLELRPRPGNRVVRVNVDPELGNEAFTYVLENGEEDAVHVDAVLDYNEDPEYLNKLLLHNLTVEAQRRLAESSLSRREIIGRLGTSASQFHRLLDQTTYRKSIDQLIKLLRVLDCDIEVVVRDRTRKSA